MKSTEFITEAQVKPYKSAVLDVDTAVALLNKHCKQSLAMIHTPLWRGMKNHNEPIVSIDPRPGKRSSQNTTNYYTEIIDHSPYFKGWPKRSKSLICSSDHEYAEGYARGSGLYAIFPYDGVPIAVCPEDDIWSTPVSMPGLGLDIGAGLDLSELNHFLRYDLGLPETYAGMVKAVKTPQFAKSLEYVRSNLDASARSEIVTPENFLEYVQSKLSPQACGFRLLSISQFASSPPFEKECWVGGPVIAIQEEMHEAFVDAVMNNAAAERQQRPLNALEKSPNVLPPPAKKTPAKVVPDTVDDESKYYPDARMVLSPEQYEHWKSARAGSPYEEGEF